MSAIYWRQSTRSWHFRLQEVFRATRLAKMTYAGPHGMACAQQAITRNWSRSLIDVGDLDTAAAMNSLYLNCTVKLTIVSSTWGRDQPGTCTSPVPN